MYNLMRYQLTCGEIFKSLLQNSGLWAWVSLNAYLWSRSDDMSSRMLGSEDKCGRPARGENIKNKDKRKKKEKKKKKDTICTNKLLEIITQLNHDKSWTGNTNRSRNGRAESTILSLIRFCPQKTAGGLEEIPMARSPKRVWPSTLLPSRLEKIGTLT